MQGHDLPNLARIRLCHYRLGLGFAIGNSFCPTLLPLWHSQEKKGAVFFFCKKEDIFNLRTEQHYRYLSLFFPAFFAMA